MRHRVLKRQGLLAAMFGALAIAACSSGKLPATKAALIGPAGGTISSSGATLEFPADALQMPVTVQITASEVAPPSDYQAYSPLYEFGPAGTVFQRPVSVTFSFEGSGRDIAVYWSRREGPGYERLSGTVNGSTITALVDHFSFGFVGAACPQGFADCCDGVSCVDSTPPMVVISAPAPGTLLLANDLNPGTEAVFECCNGAGGTYDVTAITSGASGTARLSANGTSIAESLIAQDGTVRFAAATLPQGTVDLTVETQDAAGNVARSEPIVLFIDSIAPKLSIQNPAASSGELSINVDYSDLEPGRPILLYEGQRLAAQAVAAAGADSAARTVSFPLLLQTGEHRFAAETSDLHGNATRSAEVVVAVGEAGSALVTIETPAGSPIAVSRRSGTISGNHTSFSLSARTPAPVGATAVLYKSGVEIASAVVGSAMPKNLATFHGVTLEDGEVGTFQVRVKVDPIAADAACPGDANNFCSDAVPFGVDLTAPTLSFSQPACAAVWARAWANGSGAFDVTLNTDAPNGSFVTLTSSLAGVEQSVPAQNGTAIFGDLFLAEGTQDIEVRVRDTMGNEAVTRCTPTVDISGPQVTITAPGSGTLLAANDQDASTETVLDCCLGANGPYAITAATHGAVGTARLYINGVASAEQPIGQDGVVQFPGAGLPLGAVSLTVEATDLAANTTVSDPVILFVSTMAPKLTVQSSTYLVSGNATVNVEYRDLEPGRTISLYDGQQLVAEGVAGEGAQSSLRVIGFPVLLQPGEHLLCARASDTHGNLGQSAVLAVSVSFGGPPLVTIDGAIGGQLQLNRSSGTLAAGSLTVQLTAHTPAPVGAVAFLSHNGVDIQSKSVVSGTPDNVVTFDGITLYDADSGTFQARVKVDPAGADTACPGDANNFCSALTSYGVDITAPTLSFSQPGCKAHWDAADQNSGGSFDIAFATNAEEWRTVHLTSTLGSVSQWSLVQAGVATFSNVALTKGTQTLEARLSDFAGNETVAQCALQVDDPAPSGATSLTAVRSTVRRDRIALAFNMPGEDGMTGTAASYAIRYRVCALGAQCAIDDGTFAAQTALTNLPAIVAGGTAVVVNADDMALDATITFALRVTDSGGNDSPLATAGVDTSWSSSSVTGDAAEVDYGISLGAAHITGSVDIDVVIGRPRQSNLGGGVRVVYGDGRATTDITAAQVGLLSTNARMGRAVSSAGDVDGDGYEDLLVGAPGIADSSCTNGISEATGRAYLFFGGPSGVRSGGSPVSCTAPGATEDCYIEITAPSGSGVCSFGMSLAGLGHVTDEPGQTRSLFAIGAGDVLTASTRIGKVFTYRVVGDRPNITIELVSTLSGGIDDYHFGASICGVGDVNGDSIPDLVVGATRRGQTPTVPGRGYLVFGGARFAGVGALEDVAAGGASPTDGIVPLGEMIAADSFGTSCSKAGDLDGDNKQDFAVTAPGSQRVYLFRGRDDFDARLSMAAPDVISLTHASWVQPGEVSGGYDMNGDGLSDLVVGDTTAVFLFRGDMIAGVAAAPISTFSQSNSVSTGYPVMLMPNHKSALLTEDRFPDLAIGKVTGPRVTIRY